MTTLQKSFATEYESFATYLQTTIEQLYSETNEARESCRYVLDAPGKRVRPLLCLLTCKSLGGEISQALAAATALEFVHTYSLVHDDLPAMDNDDLRRGRPTAHVIFDEATAILAGDALLSDAFRLLADPAFWPKGSFSANRAVRMIELLSRHAGSGGMISGQLLDLYYEKKTIPDLAVLQRIHTLKTGRLMGCALAMGAVAGGADHERTEVFYRIGEELGLVFQIIDDLIDELPATGKTMGKDREAGKITYLSFYTKEECMDLAEQMTQKISSDLQKTLNDKAKDIQTVIHYLCQRTR